MFLVDQVPGILLLAVMALRAQTQAPQAQPLPVPIHKALPSPAQADEAVLPELATQAKVFSIRLKPRNDEEWVEDCLNLSLDQKKLGCRIVAYRLRWFKGTWSGWFVPGVNDLYKKPSEPLRRFWACFNDHAFEIVYQTPRERIQFPDVLP